MGLGNLNGNLFQIISIVLSFAGTAYCWITILYIAGIMEVK